MEACAPQGQGDMIVHACAGSLMASGTPELRVQPTHCCISSVTCVACRVRVAQWVPSYGALVSQVRRDSIHSEMWAVRYTVLTARSESTVLVDTVHV